jgi:O-antigen ligase
MGVQIYTAGLTLIAALTAALALSRVQIDPELKRRVQWYFVIVAGLAPLVLSHPAMLVIGSVGLLLLLPVERALWTPFCLAGLLVVPGFFTYTIPFPGLNSLFTYQLYRAASWFAFLPLLFRYRLRLNAADVCFLAYVFWMVMLDYRSGSVTDGMRQTLYTVSWLALPYFAVSRSLRNADEQARMLEAILLIAVILCCATIYTEIVGWHYLNFSQGPGAFVTFERRFGLFRTGGTLASGLFGLICAFAFMIVLSRREIIRGSVARIVAALLFAFGLLASGARGAMVGGVVAGAVWLMASRLSVPMVRIAAIALVIGAPALINQVTSADLSVLGEEGTVSYRQQLLTASMRQFHEAPLLGDRLFLRSPHLAHLRQGQGIIDIVNSYLQMLMTYGIIGLGLFALTAYFVIQGLVRQISLRRADGLPPQEFGLLLAFLVGYLFYIATTSQNSYVAFFGVMLLGLGRVAGTPPASVPAVRGAGVRP